MVVVLGGQEPLLKIAVGSMAAGLDGVRNRKSRADAGLADCLCKGGQVPLLITPAARVGTGPDGT